MGRKKKDGKHLNVYLDRELLERFEKYCEIKGQTKTLALERIIEQALGGRAQKKE